jgi:hypothetical protein
MALVKYTLFLSSLVFLVLWIIAKRHEQDEYLWDAAVFAAAGFGLQVLLAKLEEIEHRVKRTKPKPA